MKALDGGERLTSCSGWFTPGKEHWHPLNQRLGGPQSLPGHFGEGKNLLPLAGFKPPTVQPIAQSLCYSDSSYSYISLKLQSESA
jgi:hypothetical protein